MDKEINNSILVTYINIPIKIFNRSDLIKCISGNLFLDEIDSLYEIFGNSPEFIQRAKDKIDNFVRLLLEHVGNDTSSLFNEYYVSMITEVNYKKVTLNCLINRSRIRFVKLSNNKFKNVISERNEIHNVINDHPYLFTFNEVDDEKLLKAVLDNFIQEIKRPSAWTLLTITKELINRIE